jgi:hypothetical protein
VRHYSSLDAVEAPKDEGNWPRWWFRPPTAPSTKAGLQRFVWDLHYAAPPVRDFELPISATPHNTVREPRGPWVQPGDYFVRLTVDGKTQQQAVSVRMDPRVKTPGAALLQQFTLSLALFDGMTEAEVRTSTARAFVDSIATRKAKANGDLSAALDAYAAKYIALVGARAAPAGRGGRGAAPGTDTFGSIAGQLLPIMQLLQGADETPTSQSTKAADERLRALSALRAQWTVLTTTDLAAINKRLADAGIPPLKVVDVTVGSGFPGSGIN